MQIQAENKAVGRVAAKKAYDIQVKFEKADASFKLFKSGAKMSHEAWFDIVHFLVHLNNNETKPSKINSVKKVLEKLSTLEE